MVEAGREPNAGVRGAREVLTTGKVAVMILARPPTGTVSGVHIMKGPPAAVPPLDALDIRAVVGVDFDLLARVDERRDLAHQGGLALGGAETGRDRGGPVLWVGPPHGGGDPKLRLGPGRRGLLEKHSHVAAGRQTA